MSNGKGDGWRKGAPFEVGSRFFKQLRRTVKRKEKGGRKSRRSSGR